ncbi:SDR family oxidoreductase [Actinacidiphila paucisporea]|uniref:Short-chain dehydrogenase n=1 Tax=Actinacidiphila paucisporea TaxID=310782 RepID=A0A1M7PL14_9ACTN|nr:SDR family oxidoreductase [Actinacidiphila paucisporea]SHN17697.1 Short-chain dehydrogenase [Actinacidiphila paucisporea]
MPQTVLITGASGGIGRATAREFARRGDRIGLVARGRTGLEAAAREVRELGGQAVVVPADVADHTAVHDAAEEVERHFGPLDVWVNVAFTSVFAPFTEIRPEDFRRVTEVTYLGYVNGTREALARMLPRDRGTIVQVGSALGARSIPLQSAYCGAKHAVNGFTSSVRTELMHMKSNVHITVVQMPAVNTPQFSWVRSRLPKQPQPVAPIYQPEVAARAVLRAAERPRRKQYYVGASTVATILADKVAAGLLDRYLARTGYDSQQSGQDVPADRKDNLWEPLDGAGKAGPGHDYGAHGSFDDRSHARSPQTWLSQHPGLAWPSAGLLLTLTAAATARARRAALRRPGHR